MGQVAQKTGCNTQKNHVSCSHLNISVYTDLLVFTLNAHTGSVDRCWAKNQPDSPSDSLTIKASRSTVRKCSKSAYVKSNDEYAQDECQIGMMEMYRAAACKGWMGQLREQRWTPWGGALRAMGLNRSQVCVSVRVHVY